ncbi:MAG: TonB-dependent receptor [Cyclobacteriaceae bacterium]
MSKHYTLLTILVCALCIIDAKAQSVLLKGHVIDASTNESIIGAHITTKYNGTVANNYGYFTLQSKVMKVQLTVTAIGFESFTDSIVIVPNQFLTISLKPSATLLSPVVITDSSVVSNQPGLSHISMKQADLLNMPAFFGEPDIFKALHSTPGIQFGKEGSSGLYVRGGTPDQNLILLDDAPLYSVNHLGGFFSVFEPYAINTLTVHTGAFPSRFGGRVSSILDIRMKEADKNQFRARYRLGLLSTSANLDIPIKKSKSSLLLSFRRGNTDLISRPLTLLNSNGTFQSGYTLYDMHVKYHSRLSDRDQLSVSMYFGNDRFFANSKDSEVDGGGTPAPNSIDASDSKFKNRNQVYWRNFAASIKRSRLFKGGLFFTNTFSISRFQYNIETDTRRRSKQEPSLNLSTMSRFSSGLFDTILRSEFEKSIGKHNLNFGVVLTLHSFRPGTFTSSERGETNTSSKFGSKHQSAFEHNVFLEDRLEIGNGYVLTTGMHYATYTNNGKTYQSLQPRISFNRIISNIHVGLSYARMTQFTHLLTNSGTGVPIDLWVPSTSSVAPVNSGIWTLGSSANFRKLQIQAEVYYKKMNNLIEFKDGASFFGGDGDDFQDKVEKKGVGRVKGFEFQIKKSQGRNTGSIAYTLSKNERRFSEINDDQFFPFRYDRRHQLSMLYTLKISDNIKLNSSWTFHSGDAITLAVAKYEVFSFAETGEPNVQYDFGPHEAHFYSGRNRYRLPAFHRLDLSLSIEKERKKFRREFSVGIYNAYFRKNPYFVYFDTNNSGDVRLYQVSLFPFVPSFSWNWILI